MPYYQKFKGIRKEDVEIFEILLEMRIQEFLVQMMTLRAAIFRKSCGTDFLY